MKIWKDIMKLEENSGGIFEEDEKLLKGVPGIWQMIDSHEEISSLEKVHEDLFHEPLNDEHLNYLLDKYNSYRKFYQIIYDSTGKIEKLSKCRAIIDTQRMMYQEIWDNAEAISHFIDINGGK